MQFRGVLQILSLSACLGLCPGQILLQNSKVSFAFDSVLLLFSCDRGAAVNAHAHCRGSVYTW